MSKMDKLRFLNISEGSMAECMNYIILSKDLGYIDDDESELLSSSIEEAGRLLTAYCNGILNNNGIK